MSDDLRVSLILRPFGGDVTIRQVGLGLQPIVLIEAEEEDDDVIFKVDATGLEQEELASILEAITNALRNGEEE